jgi:hypothetical protein
MIQIIENCQVEWDKEHGVLYVHNKDTGTTIVRVQNLLRARDSANLVGNMIDVLAEKSSVPIQ